MINWQFFPKSRIIPEHLQNVIGVFELNESIISSDVHSYGSNEVLESVRVNLEKLEFQIERSKKSNDKINEYAGHYIFLLEYDPKKKIFTYLDPALNASIVTVSFNVLEKARSHIGTDYDIIIIHRSQIDDTLKTNNMDT